MSFETSEINDAYGVRIGVIIDKQIESVENETEVEPIDNLNQTSFESKLGPQHA